MSDADKTWTVGELGRLFGLSRTALLYYDSTGLLRPSGRSAAGYRRYDEADRARLERIVSLRALGLSLAEIAGLLSLSEADGSGEGIAGTLLKRLFEINGQVAALRGQQAGILSILEAEGSLRRGRGRLRELANVGRRLGIGEGDYRSLHAAFERSSPEEHRRLLRALGFSEGEIAEFLAELDQRP